MLRAPLIAIVVGSLAFAGSASTRADDSFVLTAQRIHVSPYSADEPIENGLIVVRAGKIVAAGSREQVKVPEDLRVSRCSGGFVAAGFQNSHVHFTEAPFSGAAQRPAEELSAHIERMLTRYGFTTVLDTASNPDDTFALRARIEKGEVRGPRILTAGAPLYPHNGIPFYLRDLPPEVLGDLPEPETVEEALAVVRENLDAGADATKLFVVTPLSQKKVAHMSEAIAAAAVKETHARQRLVVAHPTNADGVRLALAAGVDILAHTTIQDIPSVWSAELIEDMVARGMLVIPTLQLWPYEMKKAGLAQNIIDLAVGDAVQEIRSFYNAGGNILFGTDVGYMTDYDPTEEYVLLRRALSPMHVLASLTTTPALRWNESDRRGRVVAGLDADLVVLQADPQDDVRNFAKVSCTIRGGRIIYSAGGKAP